MNVNIPGTLPHNYVTEINNKGQAHLKIPIK